MDTEVRRLERPIALHRAWAVGDVGLVIEWVRDQEIYTAYRWDRRPRRTLMKFLDTGLSFDAAVRAVRDSGDPLDEVA
jgi:hypothetical protein